LLIDFLLNLSFYCYTSCEKE